MRKLPCGCPRRAWSATSRRRGEHHLLAEHPLNADDRYEIHEVEVVPLGTRALLDEALKMVERLTDSHTNFTRADLYRDAVALLAKARGKGT